MGEIVLICSAGSVRRRFDFDLFDDDGRQLLPVNSPTGACDYHAEIIDALLDEDNAKEAFSGHTGYSVVLEDDDRDDTEIIESLAERIKPFAAIQQLAAVARNGEEGEALAWSSSDPGDTAP